MDGQGWSGWEGGSRWEDRNCWGGGSSWAASSNDAPWPDQSLQTATWVTPEHVQELITVPPGLSAGSSQGSAAGPPPPPGPPPAPPPAPPGPPPGDDVRTAAWRLQCALRNVQPKDMERETVQALTELQEQLMDSLRVAAMQTTPEALGAIPRTSACECCLFPDPIDPKNDCDPQDLVTFIPSQCTTVGKIAELNREWYYCRCSKNMCQFGFPCESMAIVRHGQPCLVKCGWRRAGPNKPWSCNKVRH